MPVNVTMPQMGESIAEGTITRWIKRVGDYVERDEPLFEISTDKVDAEIPSPVAGVLAKILVKENETVEINTVVAEIEEHDGKSARKEFPAGAPAPRRESVIEASSQAAEEGPSRGYVSQPGDRVRSSPLVRKMAREHNVDLAAVRGTGIGGRVSKKDVLAYLAQRKTAPAAQPARPASTGLAPPAASAPSVVSFTGPAHAVLMTPMRRQIADRMVASKHTSPHVATVFEVEMTQVASVMARCGAEFEKRHGMKLTYTPFFVRAATEALKRFPVVNASLDGANIVYKRDINIGIAVALETGLIVPVIKQAGEKNFLGVARAVRDLADRARSKRLSVDDVQDGTFTLTNHGVFGSLIGTPIINQPQVAILGVGAVEKRPVVRDDAIAIRTMVYLTLSFDHRVLDGAVADQFMGRIKMVLESWDESVL
ncbi:MAG TPA: dihydrolipoyllysine-residue succinyltransferase [Terriglobia bacterium]|nr:dihydrolipoyllysine-residue succinyltransferase [Terriglobia bacterium]